MSSNLTPRTAPRSKARAAARLAAVQALYQHDMEATAIPVLLHEFHNHRLGATISEYVDVAHAFYERREAGFVNGLLDGIAKDVRA